MSSDPALLEQKAPELNEDPRASRRWKQRASISLKRASLWREEASRVTVTENKDAESTIKQPVVAAPLKRPAEDQTPDYFQQLDEAVKKRKLAGMRMSDLPPLLSPESLFTKAIPSGINSRIYCRAPSNRIGIYFSPETLQSSDMCASDKIPKSRELPSTSYGKPPFPTVKRPAWKSSDTRPRHYNRCYDPALDSPEFDYELPKHPTMPSPPRRRKLRGLQGGSPKFTPYFAEEEDDRTFSEHERSSIETSRSQSIQADESNSKARFSPKVVESPRSLHTLSVQSPTIPSNMMKVAEDILRYQFYVENGVDERFIAPMRERWTKNAVDLVGRYVKRGLSEHVIHATLNRVLEEVQHEYILSMRKAIVDYVLQLIYVEESTTNELLIIYT